ncbi:MAG: diguanylate cyclase, partial [Hyphomicrobiaceae bacterium]|nr:diguanylate cyclase [Hyphomicrobiaceae bacterium]
MARTPSPHAACSNSNRIGTQVVLVGTRFQKQLRNIATRPFGSVSAQFIAGSVGTAVLTLTCFMALVAYQLEISIHRQGTKLEQLSETQIATALDAHVKLAASRLRATFAETQRRLQTIASGGNAIAAVTSRNVVAIWEILGPEAKSAGIDGIVVVGPDGRVIGSSSPDTDLISLNDRLSKLPMQSDLRKLLASDSPERSHVFSRLVDSRKTGIFVPGALAAPVAQVLATPMFDDFGHIAGVLIAQRFIRDEEQALAELSSIGNVGLIVTYNNQRISSARYYGGMSLIDSAARKGRLRADSERIARCAAGPQPLLICAVKPITELYRVQSEMIHIGKQEEASLLRTLFLVGAIAIGVFAFVSVVVARHVTLPLSRIMTALVRIANGRTDVQIRGARRRDEIGGVARSVVRLQEFVQERDKLRQTLESKNEQLRQRERQLRTQNALFDAAMSNMSHGLCILDEHDRIIVGNERYLEMFGLKRAMPGDALPKAAAMQPDSRGQAMIRLPAGMVIQSTREAMPDGGCIVIFEDITDRERAQADLAHLAGHDVLTGLPNRIRLHQQFDEIASRRHAGNRPFAMLCLDLDEFKTVNDSLGHAVGDELLKCVADRLRRLISVDDIAVRLGGDEFAVVTTRTTDQDALAAYAGEIITALSAPYAIGEDQIGIGVSVGIAISEDGSDDGREIFKRADLALYRAKSAGRNTHRFFEDDMSRAAIARQSLITDLRNIATTGGLETHFQPQIRLADGAITGFEALMRWRHPVRGMVSPADFIPTAEDTGLIVELGEWVVRDACRAATRWPEDIRVAVNLSARQLQSKSFEAMLRAALDETGLDPRRLELEITESVILTDDGDALDALSHARALGIKV